MMAGVTRPLASLSSGLLARKGQARPAMRPQGHAATPGMGLEDLGWNDMGTPDPAPGRPPVLAQRDKLREQIETPGVVAAVVAAPDAPSSPALAAPDPAQTPVAGGRRAAFTLRLDPERHLRLRLAAATTHRSAQAVVTAALDALLSTLPDVEELARQCAPAQATTRPTSDPSEG